MARKAPQLAKLTRPRLHKAVARERLFAKLDEAREHKPAICVVGPPGAGKTTLVASWLDARGIRGIWYQVDPGDADLATFFYYLGEAAKPFTRKGQRPLPLLTPEYLHDVERFSRRFFRELFSRLPDGAALVLDNYQEVRPEQSFHSLIAQAVDEVPAGRILVPVSRRDPPECYARLVANEDVLLLDWSDLKLTLEEAVALGSVRQEISHGEIARLHELSGGWAAGLVLLLERLRRGSTGVDVTSPDALRDVFNYFAGQLVEQFDAGTQKALMQMSYLPKMTAPSAIAVAGTPLAAALIEDLHRRHLFTDRRAGPQPVYQFHALFQAFLQHRAMQVMDVQEQSKCAMHAARLLEESGSLEEAFPLALRGGDVAAAVAIVLKHAARLIGQGRWRVVVEWIEALPGERVAANCWLLHWHGTALTSVEPAKARASLEASFNVAESVADQQCQVHAAAGIIQTYILEYTRFQPMDRWIDVLQSKMAEGPVLEGGDAELRVRSALLVALAYRQPGNPGIAANAQRVFELLQSEANVNLRAISAAYLVVYGLSTGPLDIARRARPALERLVEYPEVTVLTAGWGRFILAYSHCVIWNPTAGLEAVMRLERMGEDSGLDPLVRLAAIIGAHLELGTGRLHLAQAWLDKLDRVAESGKPYDEASYANAKVYLLLHRGQPELAVEPAKKALRLFDEAGTYFHRTLARVNLAATHLLLGDLASAESWATEAMRLAEPIQGWRKVDPHLVLAQVALERGDQAAAEDQLKTALALARGMDCIWPFICLKPLMPRLCAVALESDIEPEFSRKVIRQLNLVAPVPTTDKWPWQIRIYGLGSFQVSVNDKLLAFPGKTPKKSLALLKAMIAMGGRDIRIDKLVDALWPDLEGDAGEKAFNQALHRLRRLLGASEVVRVEDGKASLSDTMVWTDVWALEELLAGKQSAGNRDGAVFSFYRGGFMADESDAPWAVSLRERLRGKFVHHVEKAAAELESVQRWHESIALYLRGMDADPLSEAFYQGLMRCYAGLGNRAEALSVYRRLRQQLSVVLGMQPSSSSEALARELRLQ